MIARRDNAQQAPRADARMYMTKASEFADGADSSLATGRWNSAGLNAIHAGISAADAALIASAGLRSSSKDHGVVLVLLEEQVPEYSATQRRQLGGLLKMKNQVAYEQRLLTEIEARQLVDHAVRLARWAEAVVETHLR